MSHVSVHQQMVIGIRQACGKSRHGPPCARFPRGSASDILIRREISQSGESARRKREPGQSRALLVLWSLLCECNSRGDDHRSPTLSRLQRPPPGRDEYRYSRFCLPLLPWPIVAHTVADFAKLSPPSGRADRRDNVLFVLVSDDRCIRIPTPDGHKTADRRSL
jgi:hypothetical protein